MSIASGSNVSVADLMLADLTVVLDYKFDTDTLLGRVLKLIHLLLEAKGSYVCSITSDSSVYDAIGPLTGKEAGVAMVPRR